MCSVENGSICLPYRAGRATLSVICSILQLLIQQSKLLCFPYRLNPVLHVQLGKDVADMAFNGISGNHQFLRNLLVSCTTSEQRATRTARSSGGSDRVSILTIAGASKVNSAKQRMSCERANSPLRKGSGSLIWAAGLSALLDSTTGLLNCFESTDSIRTEKLHPSSNI